MPLKILILGFGNTDRQDDGIAWHVLHGLAGKLSQPAPEQIGDEFAPLDLQAGQFPHFLYTLQLVPELAETVAGYDVVCFIDAHTGNLEQDLNFVEMRGEFQASAFTHHLTPQTCLAMAGALFGHMPRGFLLSVRGYEFRFSTTLSEETSLLAEQAISLLVTWLKEISLSGDNLPLTK